MSTKHEEENEIKTDSDLIVFQTMKDKWLKKETPTWSDKKWETL